MARKRASDPPAAVVTRALNSTKPGYDEHEARCRRFDKAYRVWRGTVEPRREGTTAAAQSRMRVKYGMQVVDQTMVNVVQGAPKALCSARNPHSVDAAKAKEQMLAYYADRDHLSESEPLVVQQALVYGVSPAKNMWLYREADVVRGYDPVAEKWDPSIVTVVQDDRPTMIPWDVYDCWWDPVARNPDAADYVVLREYPTRDELERRRDDHGGILKNLDLLYQSGAKASPNQTAQNQLMNQQPAAYEGRYEVWEIWRDQKLTIIGNRNVLLYDGPKPYWLPGKPVVIGNSRPDFLRIEGISETELIDDLQQALWTHENLVMENLKMTVMRGATVRETVPDINRLVLRPNYLWPVTDHDDVQFKDPPPLPQDAYEWRNTLLGASQYVTGITPYVTGAVGQGANQDTATGVSVLNNAASKLLEFKARMIALKVYQRSYEQWSDLTDQFLTQPTWIKITGAPEGEEWVQYGPEDIFGDYDVRVQAGEESLNRQQKRAEAVALLNALAPFAQFGLNIQALMKRVADAYGFESPDDLFTKGPPALPASPQQPQLGPVPNTNQNGELVPHPAMASLMGNAR